MRTSNEQTQTYRLQLGGMRYASCAEAISISLQDVPGVTAAEVDFDNQIAAVMGNPVAADLLDAVAAAGYEAQLLPQQEPALSALSNDDPSATLERRHIRDLLLQTAIAGGAGLFLFMLDLLKLAPQLDQLPGQLFWLTAGMLVLGIIVFAGSQYFRGAWRTFKVHQANMDTLIALGVSAAWLFSMLLIALPQAFRQIPHHVYFESALIILALVNLGQILEWRARRSSNIAIRKLLQLQVHTAHLIDGENIIDIPIEALTVGNIIRVKPGEKIPGDGVVVAGHSNVDESMITGEAYPIRKVEHSKVIGGTINQNGSLKIKIERVGKATLLAQIIALVRTAQGSKPPLAKLADQVSAYFVPGVLIFAILTALIWFNFGPAPKLSYMLVTAMTVLIIACPCALGLAVPISVVVGVGKGAQNGILIRNGAALQRASKLTTVVFDKTGTLTQGKPTVTSIVATHNLSIQELLQLAASTEQHSEHPLALALVNYAKAKKIKLLEVDKFAAHTGLGVSARIENKKVLIGKPQFLADAKIDLKNELNAINNTIESGESVIFIAVDKKFVGMITIADPIKKEAAEVIEKLQRMKIDVVMLTGDDQRVAHAIAEQLKIKKVFANVLPTEKAAIIAELQQNNAVVGMVGDGINDAPALARADVGFAISTGSDIAIASADITLLSNSLLGIVNSILLSRATVRNMQQNLFGAFIYNIIALPIAAGLLFPFFHLLLNPMIAGAAMAFSSVTVVANANSLRWLRLKANK